MSVLAALLGISESELKVLLQEVANLPAKMDTIITELDAIENILTQIKRRIS